ncbi:hypothetical protein [Nonomuraea sp. KM90]|uniref:hypothetical protein n=1 Tax=Nonomuraea sp. KM90 TaxID=3457428 RepID=UPI003FCD5EF5
MSVRRRDRPDGHTEREHADDGCRDKRERDGAPPPTGEVPGAAIIVLVAIVFPEAFESLLL